MKYLLVKADTNDADYVQSFLPITNKQLTKFIPLFDAIKNFKPYKVKLDGSLWTHSHNFPYGQCVRDDLGEKQPEEIYKGVVTEEVMTEFVEEFLPLISDGIHTIKEIKVYEVTGEKTYI